MKSMLKAIIAGICIIVLGVAILLVGLGLNGWTFAPSFTTEEFIAEQENTAIKLTDSVNRVKISYGETDRVKVTYPVSKQYKYFAEEKDGTVTVGGPKTHWYNFGLWSARVPDTVVTLPKDCAFDLNLTVNAGSLVIGSGTYKKVNLKVNAGELRINDVTCENFEAKVSAGSLKAEGVNCRTFGGTVSAGELRAGNITCPSIKTKVSAGSLNLTVNGKKADYSISVSISAGSSNVSSQTGATDKQITAEVSAGSLKINFTEQNL